jgi:hypothetical protein
MRENLRYLAGGSVKLMLGTESLDDDYWAPTDEPLDIGAAMTVPLTETGVVAEVGVLLLSDSGSLFDPGLGVVVNADMSGTELFAGVGVQITTGPQGMQYACFTAGISHSDVDYKVEVPGSGSASDDDTTTGLYLSMGGGMRSGGFDIAAAFRLRLGTDVTLFGLGGDLDSTGILVAIGYSF